ncbi:MAG: hypothetical protein D6743_02865 [Calditrichaeota bacterium]|nr:MAG: hypothetical protein D6743_02865 [Calditrichota bacterium]
MFGRNSPRRPAVLVWCCFFLPLAANTGLAQRPPVPAINLSYLRIDFISPAARPAALGGAFIAAAQDESAAPINPAGLVYLKQAGASLHQRTASIEYSEPDGSLLDPDRRRTFRRNEFDQTMVSVFVPLKRFTAAIFRQDAFDSRFEFETEQFLTGNSSPSVRQALGGLGNFPGRRVDLGLQMLNDAAALAFKVARRWSLGVSAKVSMLRLKLDEQTYLDPEIIQGTPPRGNLAETTYSITTSDERKTELSYSFGVMGNVILDRLFVGAVFNQNPSFDLETNVFLPAYRVGSQRFPAAEAGDTRFRLSVPDSYGFGLYFLATSRIRFSLDLLRVEYTDLLSGNNLNVAADDVLNPQTGRYEDPDGRPDLTVSDATEIHFGVELLYKMPKLGLMPMRFGLYTDPQHRIHAASSEPDLRRLFPKMKDRTHFTFGLGFILNSYLKFDGSVDASGDGVELTGSTLLTVPL